MNSPYIHPDILLKIREAQLSDQIDILDKDKIDIAKFEGRRHAEDLISRLFIGFQEYGNIKSHYNTELLNSKKYTDFREQVINIHYQSKAICEKLDEQTRHVDYLKIKLKKLKKSFIRFLYKKKIQRIQSELEVEHAKLKSIDEFKKETFVKIEYRFEDSRIATQHLNLVNAFIKLSSSSKIWDITASERNLDTKAAAGKSIMRNEVFFSLNSLDTIKCSEKVLYLENYNGGNIYFYPNFVVYFKSKDEIAIIDYADIHLQYTASRYLEERNQIPNDTQIIGETWYRVNKDGSPDKRFASNYRIPIVLYGSLHFKTQTGLNELFYSSDIEKAEHFAKQFHIYRKMIVRTTYS